MSYTTKNYRELGGDKLYIGGEVILAADAVITDKRPSPVPHLPSSTASTAANAVKDLNLLIAYLKEARIVESAVPTVDIITESTEETVVVGDTVVLGVSAEACDGRALEYQWYANTSASDTGGTAISGATQPVHSPSTASAGTYYFYCTVADGTAGATKAFSPAVSEVCTVIVNEA